MDVWTAEWPFSDALNSLKTTLLAKTKIVYKENEWKELSVKRDDNETVMMDWKMKVVPSSSSE